MEDTKKSIIENVKEELDKIDSGIFDKYYNIIMECFDYSTKYDMEPKIEIGKVSRIFCYERGACVYEYLTSDSDEIVFLLDRYCL